MTAAGRPICNTPDKQVFRDRVAAALYATGAGPRRQSGQPHHGLDRDVEPYRCPSGSHWHLRTRRRKSSA